jgi:(p)ppGpp synthase/HD superfamily hydrolase
MIYTTKIQKAVEYAIKVHEVDEKQKRKGKDIPYVTHPLTVGLILANAGASEDVIVAGLLHDTLEDSIKEYKVTKEILAEEFGQNVADLVLSVTEQNKDLSWEERKAEALEHIKTFSNDSLLLKSTDLLSNTSEIISDYEKNGDEMFARFNAPKEKILGNYIKVITTIIEKWPESILVDDLTSVISKLNIILSSRCK